VSVVAATAVFLAAVGLAVTTFAVTQALRALWQLTRPAPTPLVAPLLVIVPARDEATRLPATLAALLSDPSPHLRVLVVDDRSRDDTADRAAATGDARVTVLRLNDDPAPGAFGKPRALAQAVAHAEREGLATDVLLFLDADVVTAVGCLGAVHAAFDGAVDAVSGAPRMILGSLGEAQALPPLLSLVGARHPPRRVHDPDDDTAFLNGQVLAVRRAAYSKAGGFDAVSDAVLEDVAFARALKASGARLRLLDLSRLCSTRMAVGLGGVRQSFGKNVVPLLGVRAGSRATAAAFVAGLPHAAIVVAIASQEVRAVVVTVGLWAVGACAQAVVRARAGAPLWPVWVLPLSWALAAFVVVTAVRAQHQSGQVSWRGRSYQAPRR
jgi:hypothetical protein